MTEIIDLLMVLSQNTRYLKGQIDLFKLTRVEKLKCTWLDDQQVVQSLHISERTLQTFRTNSIIPYRKIQSKFYYKEADVKQLLQENYYNHNFKYNGNK